MGNQNEENLKELFERFSESEEAERAAEDIRKAETTIREYPAPEPDEEVIAGIKQRVAQVLSGKKTNAFTRMAYKVAVAAVVLLIAAVSIKLFEKGDSQSEDVVYASLVPSALWESDDVTADDAELAVLTTEIEQVESEISAVQSGQTSGNGTDELTELEMDLIKINSDFWKG